VKKAAASGSPGSSEQWSTWLTLWAPVNNALGTLLGYRR
jgi:hypothetical protein